MKIYYIANARMPTEKAHGIQIAKMCEAFIEEGIDITLIAPRRGKSKESLREYYKLRVDVPIIHLPVIDWYTGGRFGYPISSLSFMISYFIFLLRKKMKGEKFILYTVDMDNYSSSALACFRVPLFSEMHGAKHSTLAQRILFKKVKGIIAINKIIVEELKQNFPNSSAKYIVEPNGVDLSHFEQKFTKKEAREKLGLPQDIPIVLYAGRFFAWKGLEILPEAASKTSHIRWQMVGGVKEDFVKLVEKPLPENMFFAGDRPHGEMSLWFTASDALLVLGTKRDIQSYRYTSPMKLFEYLAMGRSIVASSTPAIREIVNDKEVLFYEPDNTKDLARVVEYAVLSNESNKMRNSEAKKHGERCSWKARAKRIIEFIYV